MGSGIAGRRRLPRQRTSAENSTDDASTPAAERGSHGPPDHTEDLIYPQPLSYEERRDRWLRDTGNLWRTGSDSAEQQRVSPPPTARPLPPTSAPLPAQRQSARWPLAAPEGKPVVRDAH